MITLGVLRKRYNIKEDAIASLRGNIYEYLNKKKVDDILEKDGVIYFSNNFYKSGRTNWSLMSAVDAGSFSFVKNGDRNELIASYSIKRLLIFLVLVIIFVLCANSNNLISSILPSIFFSSTVPITVIRYRFFLKSVLK